MRESLAVANRLDRHQRHEAFWQGRKKKFFLAISALSFLLQLLFLGNMSYLYGSIWGMSNRYHSFPVLFVDYDHGVVGQACRHAYQQLRGAAFPTFLESDTAQYPSPDDALHAIRATTYWAAFMVNANASDRLALALQGGAAARNYDPSGAMTYIWNEVRYPPFSDEVFESSFEALTVAARLAYGKLNGTNALGLMNKEDPEALQVLFNPLTASSINIIPTTQGTKLFYNTVSMVMPILQQFFFLLILNGLSQEFKLYSKLPVRITGLLRLGLSVTFDLLAALCMSGYIWAFRESWPVSANQFVLTWMVIWLLMHVHFLILDTATAFLPLPALPFFVLTWIIINITASISPFEANPGFYRIGYALPTNEAYTILTDVWSYGSVPQLYRAMPVLFSWWIVGLSLASYGHLFRCHKAWKQEENLQRLARSPSRQTTRQNNPSLPDLSRSQQLLEATMAYRSAYGPSIPPPSGFLAEAEPSSMMEAESSDVHEPALQGMVQGSSSEPKNCLPRQ